MILSDITITERLKDGLVITIDGKRVTEGEAIQPASFDLRVGDNFAFPPANDRLVSPRGKVYNAVDPTLPAEASVRESLSDGRFTSSPRSSSSRPQRNTSSSRTTSPPLLRAEAASEEWGCLFRTPVG